MEFLQPTTKAILEAQGIEAGRVSRYCSTVYISVKTQREGAELLELLDFPACSQICFANEEHESAKEFPLVVELGFEAMDYYVSTGKPTQ